MQNPFMHNTLGDKFFEALRDQTQPRTAKHVFNKCGRGVGGKDLANQILRRDSWLYSNVPRPGKKLLLSDKIALRPKNEIDEKMFAGQIKNTQRRDASRDG